MPGRINQIYQIFLIIYNTSDVIERENEVMREAGLTISVVESNGRGFHGDASQLLIVSAVHVAELEK